jgi:hypothetical protein
MKQAILFTAFFIAAHTNFAQPINSISGFRETTYNDSLPEQGTMTPQMLSEIMNVVGLQQNFELKEAKVLNIEASISHGKRYILYNPEFISWINKITKSKWAAMALLAHEVGHHLNGHTIRKGGSKPELELEADEFAGFVLHKLGSSLEEAQEVMKYIAKPEISGTHPARASRMMAIQKGWNEAETPATLATAKKDLSRSSDKAVVN